MSANEFLTRIQSLERLLQLELASADLMDALMFEWAQNMRGMARQNIAMENIIREMADYCDEVGIDLGGLCGKARAIIAYEEEL